MFTALVFGCGGGAVYVFVLRRMCLHGLDWIGRLGMNHCHDECCLRCYFSSLVFSSLLLGSMGLALRRSMCKTQYVNPCIRDTFV
jgi:hypothetical protein